MTSPRPIFLVYKVRSWVDPLTYYCYNAINETTDVRPNPKEQHVLRAFLHVEHCGHKLGWFHRAVKVSAQHVLRQKNLDIEIADRGDFEENDEEHGHFVWSRNLWVVNEYCHDGTNFGELQNERRYQEQAADWSRISK